MCDGDAQLPIFSPEGWLKLAGGVSHRNRPKSESAPEGRWNASFDRKPTVPPGRACFLLVVRWLTPPANFRHASGVKNRSANRSMMRATHNA